MKQTAETTKAIVEFIVDYCDEYNARIHPHYHVKVEVKDSHVGFEVIIHWCYGLKNDETQMTSDNFTWLNGEPYLVLFKETDKILNTILQDACYE